MCLKMILDIQIIEMYSGRDVVSSSILLFHFMIFLAPMSYYRGEIPCLSIEG